MYAPLRIALGLAALALTAGAFVLLTASEATRQYWLAEDGPVEQAGAILWLLAALLALWRARARWIGISWALVFLLMAVRETGLPKELIPSGRRLLRLSYYLDPATPLWQRVVIGLVLGAILLALVHVGWRGVREGLMRHGWRQGAGQFVSAAVLVLVVSQLFEALPGWLGLGGSGYTLCWMLEESLETLAPALTRIFHEYLRHDAFSIVGRDSCSWLLRLRRNGGVFAECGRNSPYPPEDQRAGVALGWGSGGIEPLCGGEE